MPIEIDGILVGTALFIHLKLQSSDKSFFFISVITYLITFQAGFFLKHGSEFVHNSELGVPLEHALIIIT